jgi:hypothetical protein
MWWRIWLIRCINEARTEELQLEEKKRERKRSRKLPRTLGLSYPNSDKRYGTKRRKNFKTKQGKNFNKK